jgi:hypothetical protein
MPPITIAKVLMNIPWYEHHQSVSRALDPHSVHAVRVRSAAPFSACQLIGRSPNGRSRGFVGHIRSKAVYTADGDRVFAGLVSAE